MAKVFIKIEGIVEIERTHISESEKQDFLDEFNLEFCDGLLNSWHGVFGGGMKLVDENGNDLKND